MTSNPAADVVQWVREGEQLFGLVLQGLQRCEEVDRRVEALAKENHQLREEVEAAREKLGCLEAERVEVAETLKTFAEHVTQIATLALQRLGRRPV